MNFARGETTEDFLTSRQNSDEKLNFDIVLQSEIIYIKKNKAHHLTSELLENLQNPRTTAKKYLGYI